jgi:hypothetical protein
MITLALWEKEAAFDPRALTATSIGGMMDTLLE